MSNHGNPRSDESGCRVYVGNLPMDVREQELDDLFYKFGKIIDIHVKARKRFDTTPLWGARPAARARATQASGGRACCHARKAALESASAARRHGRPVLPRDRFDREPPFETLASPLVPPCAPPSPVPSGRTDLQRSG